MFEEKLEFLLTDQIPSKQHEVVDTALELLSRVPSVQDRTLEIVSDYVKFAYKSAESAVSEDWDHEGVVNRVESAISYLSSLTEYNPSLWSFTIVKWILSLLKSLSEDRGSTPSTVDADVKYWVTHVVTKSVCSLLTTCLDILLSMDAALATTFILDQVLGQNTLYEWIFAYIMSLHPKKLVPCLLKTVFSGRVESSRAVFQMLEFAAHSSKGVVEEALGDLLKELLDSNEVGSEVVPILSFFHALMFHSHPLVHLILPHFLRLCSPLMLYELTSRIWKSQEFPQNMMSSVIGAIYNLPGDLLMEVLHLLLHSQAHWEGQKMEDSSEENMEEGELPDVEDTSKGYTSVINPLIETLNRLMRSIYDAHMSIVFGPKHSKHGEVIEFLNKLQNKSTVLADWYLENDSEPKSSWLHLVLVVVCQSSPNIVAGKVIAHILCNCSPDKKFSKIASLILEVQDVCPGVMNFAVNSILSSEREDLTGLNNLRMLMQYAQNHLQRLSPSLISSLQHNAAVLVEGLQQGRVSQSVLWILSKINPTRLPYSLQTSLAAILLKSYFTMSIESTRRVAKGVEPILESEAAAALILPIVSKMLQENRPLTSFVCQTIVKTIVQPEMGGYMSRTPQLSSPVKLIQREKSSSLFSQHQAEKSDKTESKKEGKDPHSGTLGSRRIRALSLSSRGFANSDTQTLAISYCHEQVLMLVYECCHGNPSACGYVVEGILSQVAPTYPQNKSALDISEELQKVTVEWNLAIKKQMENYPAFWHILHIVAEEDPSSLTNFRSIIISLCTLLCNHWAQSRLQQSSDCPKELDASCQIVELCRKAKWIPAPLSRIDHLLEIVSPFEAHLLLHSVLDCLKDLADGTGEVDRENSHFKFESALKCVLRNNAKQLGSSFSVYYPTRRNCAES
jgi:hypothetical protein